MLLLAVMATGCHSSEKNYREAYEKAIERRQSGYGAEAYAEIEAERMRNTTVINGDSVRLVYVDTNVALDSADVAKTYNVVVASFTQQINAKSYRDRLRSECGFPMAPRNSTLSSFRGLTTRKMLRRYCATSTPRFALKSWSASPGSSAGLERNLAKVQR